MKKSLFLFVVLQLTACATILNNQAQVVSVVGEPDYPATVEVKKPGRAPYQTRLPAQVVSKPSTFSPLSIRVVDPCFKTREVRVGKAIDPVYWLNIFNLYGFGIDLLDGYMWEYQPQLVLPLQVVESRALGCQEKFAVKLEQPTNISFLAKASKPSDNLNRVSAGFLLTDGFRQARKYRERDLNPGIFLSYSRMLGSELMVNFRYQDYGDYESSYDTCGLPSDTCFDVDSRHRSMSVSLRKYITKNTDWFFGIGASRVRVSQIIGISTPLTYNSSEITSYTYGSFVELGWRTRSGNLSLLLNAMLDLADLRLTTARFDRNQKKIDEPRYAPRRAFLKSKLHSVTNLSNFSVGLSVAF